MVTKLSGKIKAMRVYRPDEWTMDEFLRDATKLEKERDEALEKLAAMEAELAELRAYKEAAEKQGPRAYIHIETMGDDGYYREIQKTEPHCQPIEHLSWSDDYTESFSDEGIEFTLSIGGSFRVEPLYAKPVPADKPVTRQDVIDVLLSTRGQSEGVTADAILGLLSDKASATVPDAIQLLQRDELEELLSEYSFDIGEDYRKAADAILSRYTLEHSHDNQ